MFENIELESMISEAELLIALQDNLIKEYVMDTYFTESTKDETSTEKPNLGKRILDRIIAGFKWIGKQFIKLGKLFSTGINRLKNLFSKNHKKKIKAVDDVDYDKFNKAIEKKYPHLLYFSNSKNVQIISPEKFDNDGFFEPLFEENLEDLNKIADIISVTYLNIDQMDQADISFLRKQIPNLTNNYTNATKKLKSYTLNFQNITNEKNGYTRFLKKTAIVDEMDQILENVRWLTNPNPSDDNCFKRMTEMSNKISKRLETNREVQVIPDEIGLRAMPPLLNAIMSYITELSKFQLHVIQQINTESQEFFNDKSLWDEYGLTAKEVIKDE